MGNQEKETIAYRDQELDKRNEMETIELAFEIEDEFLQKNTKPNPLAIP